MARGSEAVGYDPLALLYMVIVFASALLLPALLVRFGSHGQSDSDSDQGGGGGPGPPPAPPKPPPGGLPLADAEPSRIRLRDARPLSARVPTRQRRPVSDPARVPGRRTPARDR